MTPKTNYVQLWIQKTTPNNSRKTISMLKNIDWEILEIEHVGKGGDRKILKVSLICFENNEYDINIYPKT